MESMESFTSESSYNAFGSEGSISEHSPQHFRGNKVVTNIKCRYFMNNGYCFYGDACQFVHAAMNGDLHSPTPHSSQDTFYNSEGNLASILHSVISIFII